MKTSLILSYAAAAVNAITIRDSEQIASNIVINRAPSGSNSNSNRYQSEIAGFQNASVTHSVGGNAICIQGNIPVQVSATNTILNYSPPSSALVVSNTILEYLKINSTLMSEVLGKPNQVSETYSINSQLCFPSSTRKINNDLSLQFLIHGVGFDKSYWDFFSQNYSYVDFMASNGYTTFSYDRLGVGLSTHPDPIQIVQASLELAIAHNLVQMLRKGAIGSTSFHRIVGVGHSFGSISINGLTKSYPTDLDAAVLTGFSTSMGGLSNFLFALNLDTANTNQPARYGSLPNGYTVASSKISNQLGFFSWPNFDPNVLTAAERTKGTFALGELFTLDSISGVAANFTGPVDVVNGENDLPFCEGNCNLPSNQAETVLQALYPSKAAGSQTFIADGAGHGINLHYVAGKAYQHILGFLKANKL